MDEQGNIEIEDDEYEDPDLREDGDEEEPEELEGSEPADYGDALREAEEKYLRLYAEFDNYKKRVAKEKADLLAYANEALLYELLTSLDNLDTALMHAGDDDDGSGSAGGPAEGLREGVEMTRRELLRTLGKAGLEPIAALNEPFNPEVHHAISQVGREDLEENTVVEEFRKGYKYRDRVLRASMVSVSTRDLEDEDADESDTDDNNENSEDMKEEH